MYVHMGWEHSVEPRAPGRLDKRMLVIATVGLYGHDGELLKLFRDFFLVVTMVTVKPGNSGFFAISLR